MRVSAAFALLPIRITRGLAFNGNSFGSFLCSKKNGDEEIRLISFGVRNQVEQRGRVHN
jgi:hypothetical protein